MLQCIAEVASVKKIRPASELDDLTSIRRTTRVVACLMRGEGLTTRQVADMTGLTTLQGARYLLSGISLDLPIYEDAGTWQLCIFKEQTQ